MDEDEDVVIKDSFLYEHLHKSGYTDFESVTIEKPTPKNEKKYSKLLDCIVNVRNVFKRLYSIYLEIIQDDSVSNKQTEAILSARILLNDHGCAIYSFLDKYECKPWRTMTLKFITFGTVLSSSVYTFHNTRCKNIANLSALTVLYCIGYMEFLRMKAHRNLKSLVSLQNDFFELCKKGMKILKYGYQIKLHKGKSFQQFSDLTAGRLKYLQPIMESLVKYLGDIACVYYHASLTLVRLLAIDTYNEDLLTRFESRSFEIHGEINYQKLKTLYHTYILTQSEMLHLLAIAYDNHIWWQSYKKIPELKLAYIMEFLIRYLSMYKDKLSKHIDAYYSFKLEPMSYKYRGPDSSQWQDLYMHVYLASNKLQLAYSHMLSILQDIDNDVIENLTGKDCTENTMRKLSAAEKCVETAKDFIEFSSLFLVKSRINHSAIDRLEMNVPTSDSNVPVVTDTEPEIMDEVFEEYIKEEYLKPLSEEADEILYHEKRDRTLLKNFMAELKDALVDKKKSMSERESRALERMYKAITTKSNPNDQFQRIPTPPPMPFFHAPSSIESNDKISNDATKLQSSKLPEGSNVVKSIDKSMEDLENKSTSNRLTNEESQEISAIRLPRAAEFPSFLPASFLKSEEETFVGSGENSEDDEEIKAENEREIA